MRLSRRIIASTTLPLLALAGLTGLAEPAHAASGGLVVNEVYGGGGNSGSTYKNDFVELFNPSGSDVSVDGWHVDYYSATGTSAQATQLSGTVPAYSYYLVEEAGGSGGTTDLPTPDATGTTAMATGAGRVELVDGSTVIDRVGYGATATTYEGSGPTPAPSNPQSVSRAECGVDTDDNAADFSAGTPSPQNSSEKDSSCDTSSGGAGSVSIGAIGDQTATVGDDITEIDPQASGGTAPYSWTSEGLPDGLALDGDTGAITGRPTTSGVFTATLHVTDGTQATASTKVTFTVVAKAGSGGPTGPHVLISEVYTDGGYTGASFLNDFVELYNPTDSPVDLGTYSIGYGADLRGTGTYPLPLTGTTLSGTIPAHGHFLIQGHGDAKAVGAALPTPDLTWPSAPDFYYAAGLVVLSDQASPPVPPTGDIANTAHVVDALGYGADANTFEGSAQGTDLDATTSAYRMVDGTDTDDNHADFSVGTPTPSNAAGQTGGGSTGSCTQTDPTPSIAEVQGTSTDTSPYVGCSVTVQGIVTAAYPTGGLSGFTLQTAGTGGSTDATPGASDAVFVYGSSSAAQVTVGQSVSVTGTVQEHLGETEISSPSVTTVTPALAAVTPARLSWSDLDTDAKREAHESELIAPQGHYTVTDNYDLNYYGTIVLAADSTKPLNDPTDVARPGSADAQSTAAFDADHTITLDDGSSWNYSTASYSGDPLPWITQTRSVTIGAAATFGSDGVILDYRNGAWTYQPNHQVTDTGADVATFTDLRDGANAAPQPVGGDVHLATFNMENFFPLTGQDYVDAGLGTCTYYKDRAGNPVGVNNCQASNGDPGPRGAATPAAFQNQLAKEVTAINGLSASVVSLEEVENGAKFGLDRDTAVQTIVDALNAKDGAGTWDYVHSPAASDLPPIAQQDVIRTAFVYRPAAITPVGASHVLADDSADGQPFSIAREPLAQAFKGVGEPDADAFLVVANHWKSKGADSSGLFSDCGHDASGAPEVGQSGAAATVTDAEDTDPASDQGGFDCTRVHEAADVSNWVSGLQTSTGIQPVFLLGDFNSYTHEDPLEYLYGRGYTDIQTHENGSGAKATYSYGGEEGSLDHALANPAALSMVTGADVWQIDGQEPVAYDYSRVNYNVTQLFSADNPFGTSDHDPEIVGLRLPTATTPPATPTVSGTSARLVYGGTTTVRVTVSATGASPSGTVTLKSGSVALGSGTLSASGTATVRISTRKLAPRAAAYPVRIAYAGDDSVTSGTGSARLTVAKGSVKVTGEASPKHVVVKRTRAGIAIRVTNAAGVSATGRVTVSGGGVKPVKATLKGGRATVRLKAFPTTGAKRLTISYGGSTYLLGAKGHVTIHVAKR
ncbi:MAG: ExeM/NucH family extracellular endonuclease [Nocardioidaceae bacterium]|nr:ExeM/NucH family extracellular endonuclease [Nocardioidaceae bacterium]